jgi:hypothetical protein
MTRREAALALMDIFGAPYAHYHSFAEVSDWFRTEGLDEVWTCNETRRGFGVCGRRSSEVESDPVAGRRAEAPSEPEWLGDSGPVPAGSQRR